MFRNRNILRPWIQRAGECRRLASAIRTPRSPKTRAACNSSGAFESRMVSKLLNHLAGRTESEPVCGH